MEYIGGGYPDLPSRSLYDDSDDESSDTVDSNYVPTVWRLSQRSRSTDGKLKCKTLIISVSADTGGALEQLLHLHRTKPMATLITPTAVQLPINQQSTSGARTCFCYDLSTATTQPHDVVLMNCKTRIPAESAFDFVHTLFEHITPSSRVVVLTNRPHLEYVTKLTEEKHEIVFPIVRAVGTSRAYAEDTLVNIQQSLAAPNIVDGVAAAVMSHCEVHKITATVHVSFHETAGVGDEYYETAMLHLPILNECGVDVDSESSTSDAPHVGLPASTVYV
ncbi:hypothetical protein SARC_02077 [Sphaeroforma arctica JP610]|uniref:Proteasome assembly chaperone 1 n=1 Tax=Sphaeroforma arctica JP610 TaxID=667725 RepID=A0A0L0GA30_9EUKA|nr:hypothetical protein SARC_02077 [Sphaeroforma arctica JP610]KNC85736.1 hypothetical protein SARC_02077 [Sphaeroforma arctica JP610]|eukprot:XP_014159638.1 hypothetical protein SARC_02077 [Sphaeroforma arctica JP610]